MGGKQGETANHLSTSCMDAAYVQGHVQSGRVRGDDATATERSGGRSAITAPTHPPKHVPQADAEHPHSCAYGAPFPPKETSQLEGEVPPRPSSQGGTGGGQSPTMPPGCVWKQGRGSRTARSSPTGPASQPGVGDFASSRISTASRFIILGTGVRCALYPTGMGRYPGTPRDFRHGLSFCVPQNRLFVMVPLRLRLHLPRHIPCLVC